jgi:hypothetical protein
VTEVPVVADHAIRSLTAERIAESRAYSVSIRCVCGSEFPGVTASDFSGVHDVGLQMFFGHLAALE